jgi:hypothetical protein
MEIPPHRLVMVFVHACDFCERPDFQGADSGNLCYTNIPNLPHIGWQVCARETCVDACQASLRAFRYTQEEARELLISHQVLTDTTGNHGWIPRSLTDRVEYWQWMQHAVERSHPLFLFQNSMSTLQKWLSLDQLIQARPDRHPNRLAAVAEVMDPVLPPPLWHLIQEYL